jgi:hypothetical protein
MRGTDIRKKGDIYFENEIRSEKNLQQLIGVNQTRGFFS